MGVCNCKDTNLARNEVNVDGLDALSKINLKNKSKLIKRSV